MVDERRTTTGIAPGKVALQCVRGIAEGMAFGVGAGVQTLGRSESCDIQLLDDGVSRVHARLAWQEGALLLVDQESTNGLLQSGERHEVLRLRLGSEVGFGPNLMLRLVPRDERTPLVQRSLEGLRVVGPAELLQAVRDEFRAVRNLDGRLCLVRLELNAGGGTIDPDRVELLMDALLHELRRGDRGLRGSEAGCLLFLRGMGEAQGQKVAERLCAAAARLELHAPGTAPWTLSAGVAALSSGTGPAELLELAEARLRAAQAAR